LKGSRFDFGLEIGSSSQQLFQASGGIIPFFRYSKTASVHILSKPSFTAGNVIIKSAKEVHIFPICNINMDIARVKPETFLSNLHLSHLKLF
jgi:hypothetical protein